MRQTSLPSIQFCTIDVDKQYCSHYCNNRSPWQEHENHYKKPYNFIHFLLYFIYAMISSIQTIIF